jgi:RNA polymerase sigma factor (sigma-70 family)
LCTITTQQAKETPDAAFTELVDEYSASVYKFCRRLTYTSEDADDLFQEVFLSAFKQFHKISSSNNPKGFLFSIAVYAWKSRKRKCARRNRPAPAEELNENVSPLVKGLKPWEVNAATLGGGYSEAVTDGVLYRLVECDDVTMFADRGLYFTVCAETFIDNKVFKFNEQTGEISVNPNYSGASAIFDLPIDRSLSDPVEAEQYLNDLCAPDADEENLSPREQDELTLEWGKAVPVASTIRELNINDDGEVAYEYAYEGAEGTVSIPYNYHFKNDGGAQSVIVSVINDDAHAIRFSMDKNGVITGAVVALE